MSLTMNRKMKYRIAVSAIIILSISICNTPNWAIVVGKVKVVLCLSEIWNGMLIFLKIIFEENFIHHIDIYSGTPITRPPTGRHSNWSCEWGLGGTLARLVFCRLVDLKNSTWPFGLISSWLALSVFGLLALFWIFYVEMENIAI